MSEPDEPRLPASGLDRGRAARRGRRPGGSDQPRPAVPGAVEAARRHEVPEGGEAAGIGGLRQIISGLRREQAGARRRRRDHLHGAVLLRRAATSTTPTRPTPGWLCQPPRPTPRRAAQHPLGTDRTGFDILGRLMYGGRPRSSSGSPRPLAWPPSSASLFGAISGFFGGWVDAHHDAHRRHRALDPGAVPADRPGDDLHSPSLWLIVVIVALRAWLVPARLIRGETLTLRTREYVQAVRVDGRQAAAGSSVRHIIPNTIGTIVVNATFQVADAILLLAALGFLGFGVPAPQTDWGTMLSDGVSYAQATGTGGRSTRPASASCWWWSPSTTSATRCGTPSRSGCSVADAGVAQPGRSSRQARPAVVHPARDSAADGRLQREVAGGQVAGRRRPAAAAPPRRRSPGRPGSGCGTGSPTAG